MAYLPEQVREAIIARITAGQQSAAAIHRTLVPEFNEYPAYVVEYAENNTQQSSDRTNMRTYVFNLYIVYAYTNTVDGRELAEVAISDAIGDVYRNVFPTPDCLGPTMWVKAGDASWLYGGTNDAPMRAARISIIVKSHESML